LAGSSRCGVWAEFSNHTSCLLGACRVMAYRCAGCYLVVATLHHDDGYFQAGQGAG
jgi:hypothetical protein